MLVPTSTLLGWQELSCPEFGVESGCLQAFYTDIYGKPFEPRMYGKSAMSTLHLRVSRARCNKATLTTPEFVRGTPNPSPTVIILDSVNKGLRLTEVVTQTL